jgi:TIR domain
MASQIFVSYSQPDRQCAFELVAQVEAAGLRCWIAPRDISPAADWAAEIMDAISQARVMVLVFSASSNVSPQVRREVERAVHKQLPILPFRIEDVLPSKSLEYFLSSQHWLDAFALPREAHYGRLCQVLHDVLARDAGDPSMPGPLSSATATSLAATSLAATGLGATSGFAAGELQLLATRLAAFVGPVARVLVRRAAVHAASRAELIEQLAAELATESERRQFLQSCRTLGQSRD